VLSGFAGGPVVGGRLGPSSGLVQDTDTAFATRYRRFYNRVFTEKELAEFLRPEVYHRTRNLAFNALQDSFSRSQGGTIYDRWYALELHQRTRRFISYQLDLLQRFLGCERHFWTTSWSTFSRRSRWSIDRGNVLSGK